jgi:P27 family predicted phage terminase small subunit
MTATPGRVPAHLSSTAAAWVAGILDAAEDISESERLLLIKGAEAYDRSETARRRIERDGIVIEDRFKQQRPHPAIKIEHDSRAAFARVCAQLGLDDTDTGDVEFYRANGRRLERRKGS